MLEKLPSDVILIILAELSAEDAHELAISNKSCLQAVLHEVTKEIPDSVSRQHHSDPVDEVAHPQHEWMYRLTSSLLPACVRLETYPEIVKTYFSRVSDVYDQMWSWRLLGECLHAACVSNNMASAPFLIENSLWEIFIQRFTGFMEAARRAGAYKLETLLLKHFRTNYRSSYLDVPYYHQHKFCHNKLGRMHLHDHSVMYECEACGDYLPCDTWNPCACTIVNVCLCNHEANILDVMTKAIYFKEHNFIVKVIVGQLGLRWGDILIYASSISGSCDQGSIIKVLRAIPSHKLADAVVHYLKLKPHCNHSNEATARNEDPLYNLDPCFFGCGYYWSYCLPNYMTGKRHTCKFLSAIFDCEYCNSDLYAILRFLAVDRRNKELIESFSRDPWLAEGRLRFLADACGLGPDVDAFVKGYLRWGYDSAGYSSFKGQEKLPNTAKHSSEATTEWSKVLTRQERRHTGRSREQRQEIMRLRQKSAPFSVASLEQSIWRAVYDLDGYSEDVLDPETEERQYRGWKGRSFHTLDEDVTKVRSRGPRPTRPTMPRSSKYRHKPDRKADPEFASMWVPSQLVLLLLVRFAEASEQPILVYHRRHGLGKQV